MTCVSLGNHDMDKNGVNIKLRYATSLMHNFFLKVGLFEVLIANMLFICDANNIKINIT